MGRVFPNPVVPGGRVPCRAGVVRDFTPLHNPLPRGAVCGARERWVSRLVPGPHR